MAVLSRDEYFARLHDRLGDDSSDESITFLEDMTDTYNDMENRANGDGVNWEERYRELDETWKKRYRHRFFHGGDRGNPNGSDFEPDNGGYNPEDVTIDNLFT